jgi:hypothetical protein
VLLLLLLLLLLGFVADVWETVTRSAKRTLTPVSNLWLRA